MSGLGISFEKDLMKLSDGFNTEVCRFKGVALPSGQSSCKRERESASTASDHRLFDSLSIANVILMYEQFDSKHLYGMLRKRSLVVVSKVDVQRPRASQHYSIPTMEFCFSQAVFGMSQRHTHQMNYEHDTAC